MMRYLVDLGSKENSSYTVFCCSHTIIAYTAFLVMDVTLTLFQLLSEIMMRWLYDINSSFWIIFQSISLFLTTIGVFALSENVTCIIFQLLRLIALLSVTSIRFIMQAEDFYKTDKAGFRELANLFRIIPIIVYVFGIYVTMKMFTFSTERYNGYYDVDEEIRIEILKKLKDNQDEAANTKTD